MGERPPFDWHRPIGPSEAQKARDAERMSQLAVEAMKRQVKAMLTDTTPATPDEAAARYPYHENPLLVDALEFAHQRALVGLVHTAPDWRGCEFFPCNAYDAIHAASLSRQQGDAVAALRGDLYLRLLDHYGSPRHAMDVATLVAAALGPGWTLSRQQGDTVAARVEDVARRMHARSQDPASWDAVPDHDWWLREAALLLGIGADGAGER